MDRSSEAPRREPRAAASRRRKREQALDAAEPPGRHLSLSQRALRLTVARLDALLKAARTERDAAEAARARLAVDNLRLHAGYATALDRCAALMRERDGLDAQNAALRARLAGEAHHG